MSVTHKTLEELEAERQKIGIYPSKPDPHPWLYDLTIYAKMIAGQYSLPHIKIIKGNITGKLTKVFDCSECHNALKQQERYQQEQSNHEY